MSSLSLNSITLADSLPPDFSPDVFQVTGVFATDASASNSPPLPPEDERARREIRALLRWGGHKPSGRGRPASESLRKALEDGRWPVIHPLVDECNRLSLSTGLPISVLDADQLRPPLQLRIGEPGDEYVFNPSGQVISLKGLLLIADADGPTGGPVKDAQRSKVSENSHWYLVVVWGSVNLTEACRRVREGLETWCRERGSDFSTLALKGSADGVNETAREGLATGV